MLFKEARMRRQAKEVPDAAQRSKNLFNQDADKGLFSKEIWNDRKREISIVAFAGIGVLIGWLVLHNLDEASDSMVPKPITTTAAAPAPTTIEATPVVVVAEPEQDGGKCLYPKMTWGGEQTVVLQEFLIAQGIRAEGPDATDGKYDDDVISDVKIFQTRANAAGTYTNVIIDGQAEYLTCRAMGEPYFDFN